MKEITLTDGSERWIDIDECRVFSSMSLKAEYYRTRFGAWVMHDFAAEESWLPVSWVAVQRDLDSGGKVDEAMKVAWPDRAEMEI